MKTTKIMHFMLTLYGQLRLCTTGSLYADNQDYALQAQFMWTTKIMHPDSLYVDNQDDAIRLTLCGKPRLCTSGSLYMEN